MLFAYTIKTEANIVAKKIIGDKIKSILLE